MTELDTHTVAHTVGLPLPGALHSNDTLTLHTRHAVSLFMGQSRGSLSIVKFALRLKVIVQASEQDNPYADWFLLKQEAKLYQAIQALKARTQQYQQLLDKQSVSLSVSSGPVKLPLNFAVHGYGYLAARLIQHYDELVRTVESARYKAILLDVPYSNVLRQAKSRVRKALSWPLHWPKDCHVTRIDIQANNESAQLAAKQMKSLVAQLDDTILNGAVLPEFVKPTLTRKQSHEKTH